MLEPLQRLYRSNTVQKFRARAINTPLLLDRTRPGWSCTTVCRLCGKGGESRPAVAAIPLDYNLWEKDKGCHEYGSEHAAHVPLASHAVGPRPGSGDFHQFEELVELFQIQGLFCLNDA
ncbi:hypothetical protein PoB_007521200 [Plakobranchus ocellatus]|uniref:Uncharacterized protein n=1 Tax=Plakobranchus ocellatus TaxID=259542 RepID=A0AAV4DWM6_9GAST|nr:hypothetical protein PoB_007521200 [Plakobranchus ocellatus]